MAKMHIRESEAGIVRLFAIDLAPRDAARLGPDAVAKMLGLAADNLDMTHVEIFDIDDLSGLGLESYLIEGHGIPQDDITPHVWQLDAMEGTALLLRSSAIRERPADLAPSAPLRWIASFGEAPAPGPVIDLTPRSEIPPLGTPAPDTAARAPRGGWVLWVIAAIIALAAIAVALL